MKRVVIIMAVLVVAVVVLLTLLARRQEPVTYDVAKEAKISGTVQDVQEYYCPVTDDRGTHLVLKTDNGEVLIHVALARFLRRQNIEFAPGDKVEVLGSQIKSDAMIARQITRGGDTYIVRDASGKAVWVP